MPRVRFLVDVPNWHGNPAAFIAEGDVRDLSAEDASKWADGVRAELVRREKTERATR